MPSDLLDRKKKLQDRTFMLMFRILIIFGLPAVLGYFVGNWVDMTYNMRPYGSLLVLLVTFVFSWIVVIRMYLTLDKERKEIEALEDAEMVEEDKE